MSVQPMKFITVTGPIEQFDQVVRACIIDQQFHPESVLQSVHHNKKLRPLEGANPMASLLHQADELLSRLDLEPAFRPFPPEEDVEQVRGYL